MWQRLAASVGLLVTIEKTEQKKERKKEQQTKKTVDGNIGEL